MPITIGNHRFDHSEGEENQSEMLNNNDSEYVELRTLNLG